MYKWSEMSSRERDALVAEKVMGWKDVGFSDYETCIVETGDDEEVREFHPSTDISAAWEVVEKLRSQSHFFDVQAFSSGWQVTNGFVAVILPTAPEAICLAALRAVGVEIE